jgi:hypothetical protein
MSNMFLNIVSTFKGDGIAAATRQLGAFGSAAGGFGSTLGKVGSALASFGIAAKAVQFTQTSIDSARDLERSIYSIGTVFGDAAPEMEAFAKNAYNIGLSQKEAAKASVFLGSVLKQSGFSMADVTEQTQKLVSLGVDLATTYQYPVQEALLGMTALFRGEYDPIEKFGVAMKQSEINSELAARGLDKLEGAARRNAEQVVRMELFYQRSADALGAFTGQSGNLFVEQQKLQVQFENMQAQIGTELLPVIVDLTKSLLPLIEELYPRLSQMVKDSIPALQGFADLVKDMSDNSTTTGQTMGFLADTLGQVFSFIASNFGILVQLSLLFGGVSVAIGLVNAALAMTGVGWAIIAIGGLTAGLLLLNAELEKGIGSNQAYAASIKEAFPADDPASYAFNQGAINANVYAGILQNTSVAAKNLASDLKNVASVISSEPELRRLTIAQADRASANRTSTAITPFTPVSSGGGGGGLTRRQKEQQAAEEAARKEQEILDKRQKAFESFNNAVKSLFGQIKDSIMSSFTLPDLGNSVNSITKNIGKLLEKTRTFAKNIQTLSQQGLDATLLQQVIGAGPIQGAKLAEALVGGGSGFLQELNSAFGEFGNLAGSIAGVGTTGAFANQQTVNNYSIEVTGGVATSSDVGRAVVNAIKDFERQSGTAWRG